MLQVAADVLRGASLSCARPLLAPTMSAPLRSSPPTRHGTAMPDRAGSTDAGVDRPQDEISENGVAHARVSECAACPGAVAPGGCHARSCLGFSPSSVKNLKAIEWAG